MVARWTLIGIWGLIASCRGAASSAVWPSDAKAAVVSDTGGGFAPTPPAGSDCGYADAGAFTFTVEGSKLAWRVCRAPGGNAPYAYASGERSLSAKEVETLVDALRKIVPTKATGCGADKSVLTLRVTTLSGDHDYLDSFYVCHGSGVYVDGIDDVLSRARSLAH